MSTRHIVVGISGASGSIYGIRMLQILANIAGVTTHLVITPAAERTLLLETDYTSEQVKVLADHVHDNDDLAAPIASGSFQTNGMVVLPCSMRTLSAIANSLNDNLLVRAADVTLKERRRLVIVPRETPLHLGHLELMSKLTQIGGIILPPMPAFYQRPQTIEDIVDHTIARAIDLLNFSPPEDISARWAGPPK